MSILYRFHLLLVNPFRAFSLFADERNEIWHFLAVVILLLSNLSVAISAGFSSATLPSGFAVFSYTLGFSTVYLVFLVVTAMILHWIVSMSGQRAAPFRLLIALLLSLSPFLLSTPVALVSKLVHLVNPALAQIFFNLGCIGLTVFSFILCLKGIALTYGLPNLRQPLYLLALTVLIECFLVIAAALGLIYSLLGTVLLM